MPACNWTNAKTMANQGNAPKVTEMMQTITSDPFSACFFLSKLFDKKEKELRKSHPHYFELKDHETARIRTELILVNMYLHIKRVQKLGLFSMK